MVGVEPATRSAVATYLTEIYFPENLLGEKKLIMVPPSHVQQAGSLPPLVQQAGSLPPSYSRQGHSLPSYSGKGHSLPSVISANGPFSVSCILMVY